MSPISGSSQTERRKAQFIRLAEPLPFFFLMPRFSCIQTWPLCPRKRTSRRILCPPNSDRIAAPNEMMQSAHVGNERGRQLRRPISSRAAVAAAVVVARNSFPHCKKVTNEFKRDPLRPGMGRKGPVTTHTSSRNKGRNETISRKARRLPERVKRDRFRVFVQRRLSIGRVFAAYLALSPVTRRTCCRSAARCRVGRGRSDRPL